MKRIFVAWGVATASLVILVILYAPVIAGSFREISEAVVFLSLFACPTFVLHLLVSVPLALKLPERRYEDLKIRFGMGLLIGIVPIAIFILPEAWSLGRGARAFGFSPMASKYKKSNRVPETD
jgi:hypothetical protein